MTIESTARRSEPVFQEIGRVVSMSDDGAALVETGAGRFEALRAASCLLQPAPGDDVLLAVPRAGALYVLAVLRRTSGEPLRLMLDDESSIACAGPLSIFSTEKLELRAGDEVSTVSRKVKTSAVEVEVSSDQLRVVARIVEAHSETLKSVVNRVDNFIERLSLRVKSSYRFVEHLDMTRAHEVDMRADKTLNLRGKNAFISAEDLVKMQGDQIHLG